MAEADPDEVSDEDSTEMKALKKDFPLQSRIGVDPEMLHPQSGTPAQAELMLQRSYTVLTTISLAL
jgi:hypothetical protein